MEKATSLLRNDPRPVGDKILSVYKLMQDEGYRLEPFDKDHPFSGSLTYSLFKKQLDCDTSSALVIGVAHALGWKDLKAVALPNHFFLRWHENNYDYGKINSDKFYIRKYNQDPQKAALPAVSALEIDYWYARGITKRNLKKYDESLLCFSRAIELKPDYAKAYHNRGILYRDLGDDTRALADFNRATNLNPNFRNPK